MFIHPDIDPVALSIGPLNLRWYGLLYMSSFVVAWFLAFYRARKYKLDWSAEQLSDYIFILAISIVLGARLGDMIFFQLKDFMANPLLFFKIWQGGLSFHGGLIAAVLTTIAYSKITHRNMLEVMDFTCLLVPSALAMGRLGNFINGELWGRVTTVPWAMVFPHVDASPRHPSQLYELFLEGILVFCITWFYARKPRNSGSVFGVFILSYGVLRSFAECFRVPDGGYLLYGLFTKGMLLSFPMIFIGGVLVLYSFKFCQMRQV